MGIYSPRSTKETNLFCDNIFSTHTNKMAHITFIIGLYVLISIMMPILAMPKPLNDEEQSLEFLDNFGTKVAEPSPSVDLGATKILTWAAKKTANFETTTKAFSDDEVDGVALTHATVNSKAEKTTPTTTTEDAVLEAPKDAAASTRPMHQQQHVDNLDAEEAEVDLMQKQDEEAVVSLMQQQDEELEVGLMQQQDEKPYDLSDVFDWFKLTKEILENPGLLTTKVADDTILDLTKLDLTVKLTQKMIEESRKNVEIASKGLDVAKVTVENLETFIKPFLNFNQKLS